MTNVAKKINKKSTITCTKGALCLFVVLKCRISILKISVLKGSRLGYGYPPGINDRRMIRWISSLGRAGLSSGVGRHFFFKKIIILRRIWKIKEQ